MPATLEKLDFDFGRVVRVNEVERLLAELESPDRDVRLDLADVAQVEVGAGFRLANVLSAFSQSSWQVRLPPPGGFSDDWFKNFTRSGLGLGLSAAAATLLAEGRDVGPELREYYHRCGDHSALNYGIWLGIHSGVLASKQNRFSRIFGALAAEAIFGDNDVIRPERDALGHMTFEAIRNASDHAYKSPWRQEDRPELSYFSIRRYKTLGPTGSANGCLERFSQRATRLAAEDNAEIAGWMELIVSDNGNGIAARHSQDRDIYRGDIAVEDEALIKALAAGESVKLRTMDSKNVGDSGYGFSIIESAMSRLGGLIVFRTGRRLISLDATLEGGFKIDDRIYGAMPGTALQIVLPLRSLQLRL